MPATVSPHRRDAARAAARGIAALPRPRRPEVPGGRARRARRLAHHEGPGALVLRPAPLPCAAVPHRDAAGVRALGLLAGALAAEGAAEGLADIVGHARFLGGRDRLHDRAAMLALLRLAQDQLRALGAFAQLLGFR